VRRSRMVDAAFPEQRLVRTLGRAFLLMIAVLLVSGAFLTGFYVRSPQVEVRYEQPLDAPKAETLCRHDRGAAAILWVRDSAPHFAAMCDDNRAFDDAGHLLPK